MKLNLQPGRKQMNTIKNGKQIGLQPRATKRRFLEWQFWEASLQRERVHRKQRIDNEVYLNWNSKIVKFIGVDYKKTENKIMHQIDRNVEHKSKREIDNHANRLQLRHLNGN